MKLHMCQVEGIKSIVVYIANELSRRAFFFLKRLMCAFVGLRVSVIAKVGFKKPTQGLSRLLVLIGR